MEKDTSWIREQTKDLIEAGGYVDAGIGLAAIAFANAPLLFASMLAGAGLYVVHKNL